MKLNVRKRGKTYGYYFEVAPVDGKRKQITITLPNGCEIPPVKMTTLMKWFQKWVSPDIKKIHLEREN